MEPECVAEFYHSLAEGPPGTSVFRFNTLTIDGSGQIVRIHPPHPQFEPPIQFAYHRLRGERLSFAPEYLFTRAVFDRHGGFVPFPLAWGSDDASWILFSDDKPIVTIPTGRVRWRGGTENISGQKSAGPRKVEAALLYLEWLLAWSSRPDRHVEGINREKLNTFSWPWFRQNLAQLHRQVSPLEMIRISKQFSKITGTGRLRSFALLLKFNFERLIR
jgi:hypothetical protein